MALPKALRFTTILLLTVFSIEIQGYRTYLDYLIEEPKEVEHSHSIAKRAIADAVTTKSTTAATSAPTTTSSPTETSATIFTLPAATSAPTFPLPAATSAPTFTSQTETSAPTTTTSPTATSAPINTTSSPTNPTYTSPTNTSAPTNSTYTSPTNTSAPTSAYTSPTNTSAPTSTYTSPTNTSAPTNSTYTSPTNTSAPTNSTYTSPTNTSAPTNSTYTSPTNTSAPTSTYTPPTNTSAPTSAPTSTYTSPTNTSSPTNSTYTSPTNTSAPTSTYTSPTNTSSPTSAPTSTYTSPTNTSAPTSTYTSPTNTSAPTSAPTSTYTSPTNTSAPTSTYTSPTNTSAPTSAPTSTYTSPTNTSSPTNSTYTSPTNTSAPNSTYTSPTNTSAPTSAPTSTYTSPTNTSAPTSTYTSPTNTSSPTNSTYTSPTNTSAPTSAYTSPTNTSAPTSTYTSPTNTSAPTNSTYTSPTNTSAPTNSTYTSPTNTSAPTSTYTSPTNTSSPNSTYTSPTNTSAPTSAYTSPTNTSSPTNSTYTSPTNTSAPTSASTSTYTSPTNTSAPTSAPTSAYTSPTNTSAPTSAYTSPTNTSAPSPQGVSQNFSITINIPFDPAYSNPESYIFQTINSAITNAARSIPGVISATLIRLRSGSVIADVTVTTSSSFSLSNSLLAEIATMIPYPIITQSTTPLNITPSVVFENTAVTLTCQPPADLNFSSTPTAQWQFGGVNITNSLKYTISIQNGNAMLTVNQVASSDAGTYTCALTDKLIFMQSGTLTVKTVPDIQVTPVSTHIVCVNGNNQTVLLTCCVQIGYQVQFLNTASTTGPGTGCITYNYVTNCASSTTSFICEEITYTQYTTTITLTEQKSLKAPTCVSVVYGSGNVSDTVTTSCNDTNMVGQKIFVCQSNGQWVLSQDNCVLTVISNLLSQSKVLDSTTLPQFLAQLAIATSNNSNTIVVSPADIVAIVNILSNVATISSSVPINSTLMTNVLISVDVLISDRANSSWNSINTNATAITSTSSLLLSSIETITAALTKDSFNIKTPLILLNKTTFGASFSANLNSSVVIDIPVSTTPFNSITTILFKSMNNVLLPRDANNDPNNTINGNVILVKSNNTVNDVLFTFDVFNGNLSNPLCVFWNFSLFNGSGGWDDMGCNPVFAANGNVTCNCNHLTSFSILMSPYIPLDIEEALTWITYIGVGISMLSLVICLIIEVVIWRKIRNNSTSYLRHVSLVNIAVSLLIADIWFIIGASISDAHSENASACSTATFFIHLFYLALFFWMLASALLLLYRAVHVFGGALSEKSMLAIGFSLGYGAPLIIAIITIAVTAPKNTYIREYQQVNTCWLNWYDSKALLAFVIPALLIVAINLVILLIVLYKMLRSRSVADSTRSDERPVLVVIVKCLAVLTPLFGTTWSLGVGTMVNPSNIGIQVAFAVFNSLQGFFILVFGTLLDKKVRSELAAYSHTSGTTQSTSASSSNGLQIFRNWRKPRGGYNVTSAAASNTASS